MYTWLSDVGMVAYKFARKLRDAQGRRISHQRLYQYIRGQRAIPRDLAERLFYLSKREVPLACWRLMLAARQYYSFGRKVSQEQAATIREHTTRKGLQLKGGVRKISPS